MRPQRQQQPQKRYRDLIQSDMALSLVKRGVEALAAPLALTLGPTGGTIVSDRGDGTPEFLTDSGTIAQRVIELPERGENVGAMLIRTMVQNVRERYGDGAATAGVLAQAMLREGAKLIAAGLNPTFIGTGIERGVAAAQRVLEEQAQPILDQDNLARLATSITGDAALGDMLGEMFDLLGEQATVMLEETQTPVLDRQYVKGGVWDAVPSARILIPEGMTGLELYAPLIALVDETLEKASQVQPILEQAVALQEKAPLLIIAQEIKGEALNMIIANHVRGVLTVGAVNLASARVCMSDDLSDIGLLTGAQVMANVTGWPPESIQAAHFGRARRATLTRKSLTIAEGSSDSQKIKQRIAEVRAQMKRLLPSDEDRDSYRVRLGRLAGGMGIIKIGAYTEHERELKKELALKALRVLDMAREDGVVPGGGVAYLACRSAVRAVKKACANSDEVAGVELVANALEAPFSQIVHNAHTVYPPVALAEAERLGAGYGFDVLTGEYACMAEIGIVDSLSVVRGALHAAASVSSIALTTNTIVLV